MAYLGRGLDKISNVEVLDNITFDGSSSYTLQKNSVNFIPSSANTLLLSIDGVVQAGNFSCSSSTIDFGTAVAGTSTCDFVLHYGVGLITAPSDGSVTEAKIGTGAVTSSKLASGAVPNQSAFKNIVINGSMDIAQRSTSVTGITNGSSGYHTVDRFQFAESGSPSAVFTQSQSTDVPTGQGFAKSLKMDCTTAQGSLGAGDLIRIRTTFEGQNLQYLKKGTSSAESLTMSFWVKSSKTGTYICQLLDKDNSRSISKSYTISSADTWEKKTITYAGDTTGAFTNDNGSSLQVIWWLGAGSGSSSGTLQTSWGATTTTDTAVGQVNFADSTSNDWYITGVQLEAGSVASDFEFLPVDVNLQRCQRYYYRINPNSTSGSIGSAAYYISTAVFTMLEFPTSMRTSPSLELATGTNYYNINRNGDNDQFNDFSLNTSNIDSAHLYTDSNVSSTAGFAGRTRFNSASGYVAFSAEL